MHKVWLLMIALLAQALTAPLGASISFAEENAHCPEMGQSADSTIYDCCTDTGCAVGAGCFSPCRGNAGAALPSVTRRPTLKLVKHLRIQHATAPVLAAHSPPLNRPPIALQN